ncbi:MAG: alpha/beta hydrolase [Actinobacteria bacterium]|nr:alpha/beta hydrolase [Actinomycetota bacterium]
MPEPRRLRHHRVDLTLWSLRAALDGSSVGPLLVVHGLGERTDGVTPGAVGWPGAIWGLDLTGHGASSVPLGGGYGPEVLAADVDTVLADLGPVTLLGFGLGGYVALLVAGARAGQVRGVVVADGPGLLGGSPVAGVAAPVTVPGAGSAGTPDPYALAELSADVRPDAYAAAFAAAAVAASPVEPAVVVAVTEPEGWVAAVLAVPGVVRSPIAVALEALAAPG